MAIREPIVAGQFYPADPDELKHLISECFTHSLGPGLQEQGHVPGRVFGIISPHAGYPYSGMCAAHSFKAIRDSGFDPDKDVFVILGFSHSGLDYDTASTTLSDWKTPLGVARADQEMIRLLLQAGIVENPMSLDNEHSIEVQLPFLQYLFGDFTFVPISVPYDCNLASVASMIRKAASKAGKKACYIASSDFTHYGRSFGYVPFNDHIPENIRRIDMAAINLINRIDPQGFLEYTEHNMTTICGRSTIALLLEIIRKEYDKQNRITGRLLKYYTSGDLTGDYSHSVSYASIAFTESDR